MSARPLVHRAHVLLGRSSVTVKASARLHCGLLNCSGAFGRADGGIGVALSQPFWHLEVAGGTGSIGGVSIAAEHRDAIRSALSSLEKAFSVPDLDIKINSSVPLHIGLGSKTSLLLALGRAVCSMAGVGFSAWELAQILKRGGTSGVGVHAFDRGGFIWDAGHKFPDQKDEFGPSSVSLADPPRLISAIPVDWLKVVHFRFASKGASGEREREIFRAACPLPRTQAVDALIAATCYIVPGLLEQDEAAFQAGIGALQETGFKRVEWESQDEVTQEFRAYWNSLSRSEALGVSSLGPTLFVFTTDPDEVESAVRRFAHPLIHLTIARIENTGAKCC